jgi:hypothetical protein
MIVLHGIYDHGKIRLTDKDLPAVYAEAEIRVEIPEETNTSQKIVDIVGKYHFGTELDGKNIRDMIYD